MNLKFSDHIRALVAELPMSELGRCILWCDTEMDGAWSKTISSMDEALLTKNTSKIIETFDWFKTRQIELAKKYVAHSKLDETSLFLASLKQGDLFE